MAITTSLPGPLVLSNWLKENPDRLKPPVSNYCLYDGKDFTLMVLGGPNTRNDFHVNETEEWFYQLQGSVKLIIIENGQFRDIEIGEGEMFLLPGNTCHSPRRTKNTVGLVMERKRPEGSVDKLRWYCSKGGHSVPTLIREEVFHLSDIGTELAEKIDMWMGDAKMRKCPVCGNTEDAM